MRPEELAAIGAGLAGLSHDLRNVLAAISESAGLVDDLHRAEGRDPVDERVTGACARVSRQVDRANRTLSRLSRFAHSFDGVSTSMPVGDIVELAAFLVERRARTREVEIQRELEPSHAGTLAGPAPVRLVLLLAFLLDTSLAALPPGTRLRIGSDGDWVSLSADHTPGDRPAVSPEALAETGCSIRDADVARGEIFAIRLP